MDTIMTELNTFMGSVGSGTGSTAVAPSGMLGIWQAVLDFVTTPANGIARLGVYAWLFVMGVGGIRKLITGI